MPFSALRIFTVVPNLAAMPLSVSPALDPCTCRVAVGVARRLGVRRRRRAWPSRPAWVSEPASGSARVTVAGRGEDARPPASRSAIAPIAARHRDAPVRAKMSAATAREHHEARRGRPGPGFGARRRAAAPIEPAPRSRTTGAVRAITAGRRREAGAATPGEPHRRPDRSRSRDVGVEAQPALLLERERDRRASRPRNGGREPDGAAPGAVGRRPGTGTARTARRHAVRGDRTRRTARVARGVDGHPGRHTARRSRTTRRRAERGTAAGTQKIPATTYFPERLPSQYLRRWRA